MTIRQKNFMHVATIIATISGVVYGWMKYLMESDDPFAVVNHPWQPAMLHLHIIGVPLLLFGLGWITANHIVPKYRSKTRAARRTGITLIVTAALMVASGYSIQVTTGEALLTFHRVTHWISSAVFVLGYLVHQFIKPSPEAGETPARHRVE